MNAAAPEDAPQTHGEGRAVKPPETAAPLRGERTHGGRPSFSGSILLLAALVIFLACWLLFPVLTLVLRSLTDDSGAYAGMGNFAAVFHTPGISSAVRHTLFMGVIVTCATLIPAFAVAYGLTRARIRFARAAAVLCLLPLFAPSLFPSVGLIYLFGNQGFLKGLLLGAELRGPIGIILGSVIYCLPHAIILCITTLRSADHSLYEAARTLRVGPWRQFTTITLPHARYGLISAGLVIFILTITDFGVPKVLGGDYSMLATEIYKQVLGMQNFALGASISLVLMLPSAGAFLADAWARKKQARMAARSVSLSQPPQVSPLRDACFSAVVWCILGAQALVFAVVVWGSFISFWPYDFSLTLSHYDFSLVGGSAAPFANSLILALGAALIGPPLMFLGAYCVTRCPVPRTFSSAYRGLALLPLSIPGTVLGLAYIFAFNRPGDFFDLLYGSFPLLILNTVIHFYTVGHLAFSGGLQAMNPDYETVGFTAGVPRQVTFFRVVTPLSLRTLLDASLYIFVNALTTISAVVFLYTPETLPASVFMLQISDTGNTAAAAAAGTGLLLMALAARLGYGLFMRVCEKKIRM